MLGVLVPANEVADRAERIRATLEADGGFDLESPTEHGDAPIGAWDARAPHDGGAAGWTVEAGVG